MARRGLTDEQRVETYFRSADEMQARGTLRVAAAILSVRFPDAAPVKAVKRGRPVGSKSAGKAASGTAAENAGVPA